PLVGLARLRAGEAQHADRLALEDHREDERPAAGESRGARRARVLARVGDRQRLALPPHPAGQSLAAAIDDAARMGDVVLHPLVVVAPGLAEAQQPGFLVDGEIAAHRPALGLAYRADHRADRARDAPRAGERARDRVLQRHQALLTPALGGVAADAAIAEEFAAGPEHRLAAERAVAAPAVGVDALDLEIVERLARVEQRAMRRPAGGVGPDRRALPAAQADHRVVARAEL